MNTEKIIIDNTLSPVEALKRQYAKLYYESEIRFIEIPENENKVRFMGLLHELYLSPELTFSATKPIRDPHNKCGWIVFFSVMNY